MKQILPDLKELNKHLNFAKKSFTKRGFRHAIQYINGLVVLNKKTVKAISDSSLCEDHHSAINRLLDDAKFDQEYLEKRYLKKLKYFFKGQELTLIIDDTNVKREGKHVDQAQSHHDHMTKGFIRGHQFFTAIIHSPLLSLPLFPKLYSSESISKIDMAKELIDNLESANFKIHTILFDNWYSDKKIIKKCMQKGIKVICGVKTNRKISLKRGEWTNLGEFSKNVKLSEFDNYMIDDHIYEIANYEVRLNKIPKVKLLVSVEYNEKQKKWNDNFHLINTNKKDTVIQTIRTYALRWIIETYHRDIKQNLGFASNQGRKSSRIVRHSILVTIAYTALKLFIFSRGLSMTIGECIKHIQDLEMNNFVKEIVLIEDKKERIEEFEKLFIRKTVKV